MISQFKLIPLAIYILMIQVPSHYAPNYPLGHPKRGERGPGYGTLPQVGMVHPLPPPPPETMQLHHQQRKSLN